MIVLIQLITWIQLTNFIKMKIYISSTNKKFTDIINTIKTLNWRYNDKKVIQKNNTILKHIVVKMKKIHWNWK